MDSTLREHDSTTTREVPRAFAEGAMIREALKLALHGLEMGVTLIEDFGSKEQLNTQHKAIAAIYEALAQPEQEPVADHFDCGTYLGSHIGKEIKHRIENYSPPQRTWVGLTPQERDEINEQVYGAVPHHVAFHAAIEAKLKERNT